MLFGGSQNLQEGPKAGSARPGFVFEIMSQNWAEEGATAATSRHRKPTFPTQGCGMLSGRITARGNWV